MDLYGIGNPKIKDYSKYAGQPRTFYRLGGGGLNIAPDTSQTFEGPLSAFATMLEPTVNSQIGNDSAYLLIHQNPNLSCLRYFI